MKKMTCNKTQRAYMLAKANLEALEALEEELEKQYIAEHNIKNSNGDAPSRVWCIEDEDAFNAANAAVSKQTEESGLWADILKARELFKMAENELIEYGLSIAPVEIRAQLTKAVKTNYTARHKVIDLVFKLDVSTVPAWL